MTTLASLVVKLGLDAAGLHSGLAKVKGDVQTQLGGGLTHVEAVEKQGKAFSDLADKAQPAGMVMAGAGALIVGGLVASTKAAADFQQEMANVTSLMSKDEVAKFGGSFSKLALDLGKDTQLVTTSKGAGQAIEELVKAGVPAEAILGGAARSAIQLSNATGVEFATSAEIASQALNGFHRQASDLPKIVDYLAGTANASAAGMGDMRQALQAVGSVAPLVGMSFEDTATAIGLFANNSLKGSDAGTSLKTMLINLEPHTNKQSELMHKLGLITADGANQFFTAEGKAKSLAEIAGVLQKTLAGMTLEQREAKLKDLFGTDAIRAAAILATEGAEGVNKLQGEIGKISAADVAAQRMNTLNGALESLKGSLEAASITVGTLFLPPLASLARHAMDLVNAFLNLPAPVQTGIVVFMAIAGVLLTLVGGFILIAPFLAALPAAFAAIGVMASLAGIALGTIAAILLSPVVLIGALIAAVALLGVAWANNWGGIHEKTAAVVAAIGGFFDGLGTRIHAFVETIGPQAAAIGKALIDGIVHALVPQPIIDAVKGLAGAALSTLKKVLGIASPSQVMADQVGKPIAEGIAQGVQQHAATNATRAATMTAEAHQKAHDAAMKAATTRKAHDLANPEAAQERHHEAALKAAATRRVHEGLAPAAGTAAAHPSGSAARGGLQLTAPLIGQVIVQNEADEDRLTKKLYAMLVEYARGLGMDNTAPSGLAGARYAGALGGGIG